MLLKLLKYDFRAMWKSFSLIWGAALILAVVNRFTIFRGIGHSVIINADLLTLTVICVIMAMLVISIIFVISRFSKGLLGNEGYLMHTLPVRPWQLVASKLICGTATWIISGLVAFAVPLIMTPTNWSFFLEFSFWNNIFRGITKNPGTLALIVEFCLLVLSVIVLSIAQIYLAVSAGHLFPRHRRLAGIAAFIGLYVLLANFYARLFSLGTVEAFVDLVSSNAHGSLLTCSASMLIPAAVFLAAVSWILEHKLNLE